MENSLLENDIAIIGFSGKFPGADTIEQYWKNIINKVCSITEFNREELIEAGESVELVNNPNYIKRKGYLKEAEYFDADFFKFSKHEAEILDPQFRILFKTVWQALEQAAYVPETFSGKIGVFVGSSNIDTYYLKNLLNNKNSTLLADNFTINLHNAKDFLAPLIAYKMNLNGPAINVQTACSTSLVTVCLACQNLLNFESDIAIAGGVCITTPLKSGYLFQEGLMLSPTGECSTFDKNANGIVLGNGAGIVVLKRLNEAINDGDYIHAVIKGFAINNDASHRIGFTAPSVAGQQAVIKAALKNARILPEMVSYIETHGTGTILGDLIEIEALASVFGDVGSRIALGSVKPNIGHLDTAAGIASLIKVVQAMKNKVLPPNINFDTPSTQINFKDYPFYVNTSPTPWISKNTEELYAGISSFGMGGTNAHIILTEAPPRLINQSDENVLLILSAKTEIALKAMKENLAVYLEGNRNVNLVDVAYTLQVGRKHFKRRWACICGNLNDLIKQLRSHDEIQDLLECDNAQETLRRTALAWIDGAKFDWEDLYEDKPNRVPLPTYPFEEKYYWISETNVNLPAFKSVDRINNQENSDLNSTEIELKIKNIFENFFSNRSIDTSVDFVSLGGDSLVALLITHEINTILKVKIPFSIFYNNLSVKSLINYIVNHIENRS